MGCVVLWPGQMSCTFFVNSFGLVWRNSVWRKKSVPDRHRKVLEKVADIDYVLKVWTILYVHICVIVALHTNSCLVFPPFLFHHCHLGTDNPWIWRTLHHFVIRLQNMQGLLPWCQSRQKTAQYSSAHLVSQRWRWPLLSSKLWVKNRWRWTLWSASVFLWKIYDILILIHTISHLPHNPHTPTPWNIIVCNSCSLHCVNWPMTRAVVMSIRRLLHNLEMMDENTQCWHTFRRYSLWKGRVQAQIKFQSPGCFLSNSYTFFLPTQPSRWP